METLQFKLISALEKCFYDEDIERYDTLSALSMLQNEVASFQIAYRETDATKGKRYAEVRIGGALRDYITVKQVVCVPSAYPAYLTEYDDNYLRRTPGLYPDLIQNLHYQNRAVVWAGNLRTLWCDIALPQGLAAGEYATEVSLYDGETCLATTTLTVTVAAGELPKTDICHTEWFYCDCLAQYYHVDVFSEAHWQIIENFARTAVQNGVNTLMMPVFTPALDTYVGGERLTCQLVDVTLNNGVYSFGFDKMDRWIAMCKRLGVEHYEIPPFYTQWGAKAAPKIIATVDGEERRLFGWDTDSLGESYVQFLDAFIPALVARLKEHGVDKQALFHVSDEPSLEHFDHYSKTGANIKRHLDGYTIIDAVSHLDVCTRGGLKTPVVILHAIHSFLEAGIKDCWAYYCCGPAVTYSNRHMSMPTARTRILGVQLYKFSIKGFLHWGYNFYNSQYSYDVINPYLDTTGDYFAPSGDTFLVYPGADGNPEVSLRLMAMRDAFQDYRALTLCEQLYGRDFTVALINEGLDYDLTFDNYPKDAAYLLELRRKVNAAIAAKQ